MPTISIKKLCVIPIIRYSKKDKEWNGELYNLYWRKHLLWCCYPSLFKVIKILIEAYPRVIKLNFSPNNVPKIVQGPPIVIDDSNCPKMGGNIIDRLRKKVRQK